MPTANLYLTKIDLKGNVEIPATLIVTGAGAFNTSGALETDGSDLYLHFSDGITTSQIYKINKKLTTKAIWNAPSVTTKGLTTDGRQFLFSTSASTMNTTTRRGTSIRTAVALASHYVAMTMNHEGILGIKNGTLVVELLNSKDYTVRHSITLSAGVGVTGLCWIGDRMVVIDSPTVRFFKHSGAAEGSVTLPAIGTRVYKDVCHDRDFLWVSSYEELPDIELG